MDLVFEASDDLRLTENHIRQLHKTLLRHSNNDVRHRGSYKTLPHNVVAIDETARLTKAAHNWQNQPVRIRIRLKVRLRELVNAGLIQRHGKARATWYSATWYSE